MKSTGQSFYAVGIPNNDWNIEILVTKGIYKALIVISVCLFSALVFYHTDPAGTPLAMSDSSGNVVWRANYKPFGEENTVAESQENDKRFVGKEKDEETGHYYFGARYMDPKTGRFIAVDPVRAVDPRTSKTNEKLLLNPQMLNPYVYSLNNPYRYIDPDGREVRISGHVAAGPLGRRTSPASYHLSIVLRPDRPQDFTDRTGWSNSAGGQISATLGGQCCGDATLLKPLGNLQSTPNNPDDSLANGTFSQVVPTPDGMSDTQFINALIKAANSYDNDLQYSAFPSRMGLDYNSNSFISGVLNAAGAIPPVLNTGGGFQAPGYDKPIPIR